MSTFAFVLFCGWLGVAALGSEADHSPIPNEAPLDFSFRDCGAHHEYLGPTVNIGNGLVVAFNGSHTRIMNSNVFQNGDAEDMGYWAWDIIDDGSGGSGPQAREGHAMAPLGNFSLIMFGGIDSVTNTPLDDSWIFQVDANDFSTGTWTLQTHGEADAPTARTSHAMAPLAEGKVLLYGGLGYIETEEPLDDVWIFEDDSWSQVNSSLHNSPGPRFGHSLTPLAKGSGQVIMFGGVFQGDTSSTTMQDTWVFDFGTRNWEEKKSSMLPPPRQGHATAYTKVFDVNAVLMFGGYSGTDPDFLEGNETQVLKDSWMFYVDSMTWKVAADFDYDPEPRLSHQMTAIGDEGRVILLHGGKHFDSSGELVNAVDAWTYQSPGDVISYHEWSLQVDGPSPRSLHAMASLEGGRTLMYGGWQYNGDDYVPLNDAWIFHIFDDADKGYNAALPGKWQRAKDGPSPRHSHAMASITDSLDGTVLMFGGRDSEEILGDAWTFTCEYHDTYACNVGSGTWQVTDNTTLHPTPSKRYGHDMAALERGQVIMFGGRGVDDAVLGDSWIYDFRRFAKDSQSQGCWEPATASTGDSGPSARFGHAMAALDRNTVMLHGGMGEEDYALDDVWIYEISPDNLGWGVFEPEGDGPGARYGHAMASLGGGRAILHGGQVDEDSLSADTHLVYNTAENSEEQPSYTFMQLSLSQQLDPKRYGHAMSPLELGILSDSVYRVILFGGSVQRSTFGITVETTVASDSDDTWTLLAGCPSGVSGPQCDPCKNGTYSDTVTGDFDSCLPCPVGTTTHYNGSNTSTQCTLCAGYSPVNEDGDEGGLHVSCHVDLNSSTPVWRCNGRWGQQCEFECPGGSKDSCSGQGVCSDGVDGTGECTCNPGFYGTSCEHPCNCGGHGKCDDGMDGSGSCSCEFFYVLSGSSCAFPTLAFLLVNFLVVGITVGIMKRTPNSHSQRQRESLGDINGGNNLDMYTPLGPGDQVAEEPNLHFSMEMGRREPAGFDVEDNDDSEYVPPSLEESNSESNIRDDDSGL